MCQLIQRHIKTAGLACKRRRFTATNSASARTHAARNLFQTPGLCVWWWWRGYDNCPTRGCVRSWSQANEGRGGGRGLQLESTRVETNLRNKLLFKLALVAAAVAAENAMIRPQLGQRRHGRALAHLNFTMRACVCMCACRSVYGNYDAGRCCGGAPA